MKKTRLKMSLLITVVLLSIMAPSVCAQEFNKSEASTYSMCPYCEWYSVNVCAKNLTLYAEGYHSGFMGFGQTDCYAKYYKSHGYEMCSLCERTLQYLGEHDCLESHAKCSKGEYNVCIMK